MIKSVVESNLGEIEYPCIMMAGKGIVVLFKESECETVVNCGTSKYTIGQYLEMFDMTLFKPFHGSVTLTQE